MATVGSGQYAPGTFEAKLYQHIKRWHLARHRKIVTNTPASTHGPGCVARGEEVETRADNLTRQLALRPNLGQEPLWLVATSLGCYVALRALEQLAEFTNLGNVRLVFIGFVVDDPIDLPASVRRLDLLTGELDFVQYAFEDGGTSPVLSALQHQSRSLQNMQGNGQIILKGQVVSGCDHFLEPVAGDHERIFKIVTDLFENPT